MPHAWKAYAGLGTAILAQRLGSTRPFKITLSLTDRCDCRCRGCFIWKKDKGYELDADEIESMLVRVPSLRWVNLTGGEPFLRDDLLDIVQAVSRALPGLAVLDLPTTGQRTEHIEREVRAVAALGIPRFYVTVSLEGPEALHDELRGREGAFRRMVRTYAALRRTPGVEVYLGMTLSDANAMHVDAALAEVAHHLPADAGTVGWGDLHLNVFTTSDHYYGNRDSTLGVPPDVEQVLGRALRAREGSAHPADRIEAAWMRLLPEHVRTGRSPLPCKALRASVFVSPAGDVHPCTVWSRPLGNVRETPFDEILRSVAASDARDVVARDRCPGCWSPCEAYPTIVASAPESLLRRARR